MAPASRQWLYVPARRRDRHQPGHPPLVGQIDDAVIFGPPQLRRPGDDGEVHQWPQVVVGQTPGTAARLQHVQPRLPQRHPLGRFRPGGDQLPAVRRPGQGPHVGQPVRPASGVPSVGRHYVDLGQRQPVPVRPPPGDKGYAASVGRPHRRNVVPVPVGNLCRLAPVQPGDEQVEVGVAPPAKAVEPVAYPVHHLDLGSVVALAFLVCPSGVHVGAIHHAPAVGRPGKVGDAGLAGVQRLGFPASHVHHPQTPAAPFIPAQEGQPASVGRELGDGVRLSLGELPGLPAAQLHHHDTRAWFHFFLVNPGIAVGQQRAVGRQGRVAHRRQPVNHVRLDWAGHQPASVRLATLNTTWKGWQ